MPLNKRCSVYEEGDVPIGKKISQCATRAGYSATFRISRIIGDPLILILRTRVCCYSTFYYYTYIYISITF